MSIIDEKALASKPLFCALVGVRSQGGFLLRYRLHEKERVETGFDALEGANSGGGGGSRGSANMKHTYNSPQHDADPPLAPSCKRPLCDHILTASSVPKSHLNLLLDNDSKYSLRRLTIPEPRKTMTSHPTHYHSLSLCPHHFRLRGHRPKKTCPKLFSCIARSNPLVHHGIVAPGMLCEIDVETYPAEKTGNLDRKQAGLSRKEGGLGRGLGHKASPAQKEEYSFSSLTECVIVV